jgi:hypothetical protein
MKKLRYSLIDILEDEYLSKKLKFWFMIRVLFLYPIELLEDKGIIKYNGKDTY